MKAFQGLLIRGGVRLGAVPLATVVQPFRLERVGLAFFQYEDYFRTPIYWVASRLPLHLPNPFPVAHTNSHGGMKTHPLKCGF